VLASILWGSLDGVRLEDGERGNLLSGTDFEILAGDIMKSNVSASIAVPTMNLTTEYFNGIKVLFVAFLSLSST